MNDLLAGIVPLVIPGAAQRRSGIQFLFFIRKKLDSGFAPAERPGMTNLRTSRSG